MKLPYDRKEFRKDANEIIEESVDSFNSYDAYNDWFNHWSDDERHPYTPEDDVGYTGEDKKCADCKHWEHMRGYKFNDVKIGRCKKVRDKVVTGRNEGNIWCESFERLVSWGINGEIKI